MAKIKRALDLETLHQNFAYCNNGINYNVEMKQTPGCACGEIHHCWLVASASVSNIDINRIIERMFASTKENADQILKYCFHRILTHSNLFKIENWIIKTKQKQFGEAIDTVLLDDTVAKETIGTLAKILSYDQDLERVLFVLRREYDTLDLSKVSKCRLETVSLTDLFPALKPIQLLPETVLRYNGYFLPSCVCLKAGAKYKILDGFRRLLIAQQNGQDEVNAIVLEE